MKSILKFLCEKQCGILSVLCFSYFFRTLDDKQGVDYWIMLGIAIFTGVIVLCVEDIIFKRATNEKPSG